MYYLIVTKTGCKAKVSEITFNEICKEPNAKIHEIFRTKENIIRNNDGKIVEIKKVNKIIGKVCNL